MPLTTVGPRTAFRAALLVALLLPGPAGPAFGQEQLLAVTEEVQRPPAMPEVDETALHHFARQGDQRRLEAETARLQALYPGWVPPADPLATDDPESRAVQAMWDLYGAGDLDGVTAAIAERRAAMPGWQPPADLATAVEDARTRQGLTAASDARDFDTVIALAATHPDLLTCANIDLLWRLGEAFVGSGRAGRGRDAFAFILTTCDDAQERLATMQKAVALLDRDTVLDLLAHERGEEFAGVELDLARRAVSEFLDGRAPRVAPEDADRLEAAARDGGEAGDLLLLGHYELKVGQARQALDWFDRAFERDGGVEAATARAAALMARGRDAEAEAALVELLPESEEARDLYLDVVANLLAADPPRVLAPEVLARMGEAIVEAGDATAAMNMGWYAYNFDQVSTAASWFREALAYDPTAEAAAYGLVVASHRLRDRDTIRQMQERFGEVSPRIALFGRSGAPTAAPMSYAPPFPGAGARLHDAVWRDDARLAPVKDLVLAAEITPAQRAAGQTCPTYVPPSTLSVAGALRRGWCLLELDRPAEAAEAFRRALQTTAGATRADAAYGLTLAYVRLNLVNEAAVAAALSPQTPARVAEMQIGILTATAVAFYDLGRYREALEALDRRARLAPEQNDLLTLRAWSYYHLGHRGPAEELFRALAATGHRDAAAGLAALGLEPF